MKRKTAYKIVTVLMAVTVVVIAVYIMAHHLGLSDKYDFGAGAYYYADIPDFEEVLPRSEQNPTSIPTIIYIVLFLAWGWLMWRLWLWVDGKIKKKNGENE